MPTYYGKERQTCIITMLTNNLLEQSLILRAQIRKPSLRRSIFHGKSDLEPDYKKKMHTRGHLPPAAATALSLTAPFPLPFPNAAYAGV